MKMSPSDQNTIPQVQNTIQTAPKATSQTRSSVSASSASVAGKTSATSIAGESGPATLTPGITIQDLMGERLLMSASRTDSHGRKCPTLNGIPLLAKLGQGGMGAVYYGIHPRLRSEVAVKVLPFTLAEQDPGMIRRFFREAQIAAQVRSPHLVNVMDVNEESGLFFLVMEYVSGCTAGHYLKALLEKGQPGLPELDALDITIAATEGLWAAHANNVIHRDIKPENIMIPYQSKTSREHDLPRAKLMDLGLARNEDSQQSLTGAQAAMGTPGYMAPEQAMDAKSADKRSDVFSMGCTLYALLCGRPPFKGETVMKVLMATMHEPHEPLIKVRTDISPAVNDVLEKCLAKKQDHRYADARQLLAAVQDCRRLLTGGSIAAGALSGAQTLKYVAPGAGPAAAGAATPLPTVTGAVGEKTFVPASGTPTPAPTVASAPPKSKGVLYVAAAAGVLVLTLGGIYLARRGGKPTDATSTVVTPEKPGPGETGAKKWTPEELERLNRRHTKLINDAKASVEAGDPEEAKFTLDLARTLGLDDTAAKSREQEIEKGIKRFEDTKAFAKVQKDVAALLEKGSVDDLKTAQKKLTDATVAYALDDKATAWAAEKDKIIRAALVKAKKREDAEKLLADATKLVADKPDEAADKLDKILSMFPDANDKLNKDATRLKSEVAVALGDRKKKDDYDRLVKAGDADFTAGKFEMALDKALQAQTLLPKGPEAAALIAKVNPKLDEAKRKEAARKEQELRDKKLADALAAAKTQLDGGKLDEAAVSLKTALEVSPVHEGALALQKRLLDEQEKQRTAEEQQKKTKAFDDLLATASRATEDGDLDAANKQLAEARKLFPDDQTKAAAIQTAEKKLAEKKEIQRLVTEYEGLVSKAKEARRAAQNLDDAGRLKKLEEAQQFVKSALQLGDKVVEGKGQLLKTQLDGEIGELKGNANKESQYNTLVSKGGEFETAGDAKGDAFDEKLSQYQLALKEYGNAKALKPGGPADQKETQINRKISDTKAAKAEDARKKADAAAGLAAGRQKFDAKIGEADAAAAKGDYAGAQALLAAAKAILADDAATRTLEAKAKDYEAKKKQVDDAVGVAFAKSLDALKNDPADLAGAMAPVQKACQDYPANGPIAGVRKTLQDVQEADVLVKQAIKGATDKLAVFSKNKKLENTKELREFDAACKRLQGLTAATIGRLTASQFKDATEILRSLNADLKQVSAQIEQLAPQLEKLGKEKPFTPIGENPIGEANDDGGKKTPKPVVKKPKAKGSVGEGNIDD